ncbi:ESX secretion-associated protein EspG [Mycolicibacterium llatzerense]|uniref:ESX secretion-associated protein EspG n=1 Tax=Mycolicibacterium llatzerense TaxID=280871 RepID=UPI0021B62AF1|nr:ESX secretion-associated protein EspG [Mycolicibacterium llatzerense]MCT7372136.1 secretion protein EspG [Mycolicibacterium llatzerense]
MLTTSLDGLWALQAAAGIEQLCPEMRLRPLLPRLDTKERALEHPVAQELIDIGAMTADGVVDQIIVEWLTVIARRDVSLLMTVSSPGIEPGYGPRASLNRFAQWWVTLEVHDQTVRLSPLGVANDEASAGDLVVGQIENLCGVADPASLRPVTISTDAILAGVRDVASLKRFLTEQRLDAEQTKLLMLAADSEQSSSATIVALQAGAGLDEMARVAVGPGVVSIADTVAGRILVENVDSGGLRYQVAGPGSRKAIAEAIVKMIRRLPAGEDWYSHRRVV